jgi:hypothetical protein
MNNEHGGITLAIDTLRKHSDQSRLTGAVFRFLGYMAGDEDIQVPKDPSESFVRKREEGESRMKTRSELPTVGRSDDVLLRCSICAGHNR